MIYHTMQKNADGTFTVGVYVVGNPGRPQFSPLLDVATFQEAAKLVNILNGGPMQP